MANLYYFKKRGKLFIGHTNPTHSYLTTKEDQPKRPTRGTSITVKSLLRECFKYD